MKELTCKHCLMHSGIPYISINQNGECSDCTDWIEEKKIQHDPKKIMEYTEKMEKKFIASKKKGHPYNALVLLSGGKDSTQLIYLATKKYNLNVLAFTMALPIGKYQASENVKNITKKLNIDSMVVAPNEKMYKAYMRYSLLNGHKYGLAEDSGCAACSFLFRWYATRIAAEMNIPVILDGRDKWQHGGVLYYDGEQVKQEMLEGIKPHGKLHDMLEDALGEEYQNTMYGYDPEVLKDKTFPDFIAPFTFIKYDTIDSLETIKELGLDKNSFETMFTNCDGVYFFDYISWNRFNCSSYHRGYSHGLRQNIPTIGQLDLNHDSNNNALDRETTMQLLDEYRKVLDYIGDNKLSANTIKQSDRDSIVSMIPLSMKVYGKTAIDLMMDRALKVTEFAEYFDLELDKSLYKLQTNE